MSAGSAPIEPLRALAHPLRWRILTALAEGERNVGEIEKATRIGQPALSQQLGVLRKAGLVATRKEAKLVFYSLAQETLAEVTTALAALASAQSAQPETSAPRPGKAPGVAHFARLA